MALAELAVITATFIGNKYLARSDRYENGLNVQIGSSNGESRISTFMKNLVEGFSGITVGRFYYRNISDEELKRIIKGKGLDPAITDKTLNRIIDDKKISSEDPKDLIFPGEKLIGVEKYTGNNV